jgi:HSP20 family molecular chaperone IbpA
MKCARCGYELDEDWRFCPRCGSRRGGDKLDDFGRDLFSQMFGRIRNSFREFDEMEKAFDKDIQAIDLSPFLRGEKGSAPRKRGFTVHIRRGTGMKPRVDIKTFGNVKRDAVEKQVKEKFGMGKPAERRKVHLPVLRRTDAPKVTEEPKADVRRIGDRVSVDIEMPNVKNKEDIEVRELGSSVEVKAIAGDKAYFKILTKPENLRLTGKSFRDGALHLEFS